MNNSLLYFFRISLSNKNHFLTFDLSNFLSSTLPDFIIKMARLINREHIEILIMVGYGDTLGRHEEAYIYGEIPLVVVTDLKMNVDTN